MTVDISVLLAFVYFAFVASITPGPNNMMVMASGAAFGVRATLPHIFGIAFGFGIMLSGLVLGLGVVLDRLPIVLGILKWGGVAWLAYMAWQLARPALSRSAFGKTGSTNRAGARPLTLIEAALFQWINPKAWTMAVAVTGAYADLAEVAWQRAAIMLCAFFVIAPLCNWTWLLAGRVISTLLFSDVWGRVAVLAMAGLILLSATLIALG